MGGGIGTKICSVPESAVIMAVVCVNSCGAEAKPTDRDRSARTGRRGPVATIGAVDSVEFDESCARRSSDRFRMGAARTDIEERFRVCERVRTPTELD